MEHGVMKVIEVHVTHYEVSAVVLNAVLLHKRLVGIRKCGLSKWLKCSPSLRNANITLNKQVQNPDDNNTGYRVAR